MSLDYSGEIHSFYNQQNTSGCLYIIVAAGNSTNHGDLVAIQPFNPVDYDLSHAHLDVLVIPHESQANMFKVIKLSLVGFCDDH